MGSMNRATAEAGLLFSLIGLIVVLLFGYFTLFHESKPVNHLRSASKKQGDMSLFVLGSYFNGFEKGVRTVISEKKVVRNTTYFEWPTSRGYFTKTELE